MPRRKINLAKRINIGSILASPVVGFHKVKGRIADIRRRRIVKRRTTPKQRFGLRPGALTKRYTSKKK